ncbi:MAG TPA: hypothetical protein VLI55_23020 [Bryobacteraceae bacterium]|nr:hypothetical protein [Bryobacteraceae bacterium]
MISQETKQAPLETLVFTQLAAIRRHEASLEVRLSSSAPAASGNVADELAKLQICADRLNRMIDAMS